MHKKMLRKQYLFYIVLLQVTDSGKQDSCGEKFDLI